jgi:hypothetical protein
MNKDEILDVELTKVRRKQHLQARKNLKQWSARAVYLACFSFFLPVVLIAIFNKKQANSFLPVDADFFVFLMFCIAIGLLILAAILHILAQKI